MKKYTLKKGSSIYFRPTEIDFISAENKYLKDKDLSDEEKSKAEKTEKKSSDKNLEPN